MMIPLPPAVEVPSIAPVNAAPPPPPVPSMPANRRRRNLDGGRRFHRNHGVVGVHAVVVPAVNGDRQRVRQLDARQLQVVHDEAGCNCGKRIDPRFNNER